MITNTATWAFQTIDTTRGETDWSTQPPIRTWLVEATTTLDAAREIAGRSSMRCMPGVRARIAVWDETGDWNALRLTEPHSTVELPG